jgi:hypothetical protein
VAWDDTKLIDGYPGEKVVIARKKGDKWYIGAINGTDDTKILTVTFKFLEKDIYQLRLIKDGLDCQTFKTDEMTIKKGQKVEVLCLPRGGFVGVMQ